MRSRRYLKFRWVLPLPDLAIGLSPEAQTSRGFHQLCVPLLYRHVDLSFHNDEGTWDLQGSRIESDDPRRRWARVWDIFRRQQAFIVTVLNQPQYATNVRSLIWTFQKWVDEAGNDIEEGPTWMCFKAMKQLAVLDFCSMTPVSRTRTPLTLFPSTKSVRIGGLTSLALATSILHSIDPSHLTSLDLNNLQDLGQLRERRSFTGNEDFVHVIETRYSDGSPTLRHSGIMRDHLRPLTGKCTALQNLTLRSVGSDYPVDPTRSPFMDQEGYEEWAAFIASVRSTLKAIRFEQGIIPQRPVQSIFLCDRGHPRRLSLAIRAMHCRFIRYIEPVFTQSSWPALKTFIIRGIGGRVDYPREGVDDQGQCAASKERLRVALQLDGNFIFESEAGRSFYHRENDFLEC